MGLLNSLGDFAEWMSTSQRNNNFYLVRTPLFKQFLDICVWNYPDPLDLFAWSYEIVPMYFFAGAIDYSIMTFFISLYSQFTFAMISHATPGTAPGLLTKLQSPRSSAFQALFLFSFVLRAWNLGLGNIKRTCNFHSFQWTEMRRLTVLILLLCPALFWNWFLEVAFRIFRLDRDRPWLVQLFWLILSRDWDIAQFYSSFYLSKGVETLGQENAARLNETWGGFVKRATMTTLIATPLEMFVKNLPYMVVALVFAVGRNGPAISTFLGRAVGKLRTLSLVERFPAIDAATSARRDLLLLMLIRSFRRGRISWSISKFPKYIAKLRGFSDANLKPILLALQRCVVSVLRRSLQYTKTLLQYSRLVPYFKTVRINSTSEALPARRFRLLQLEPSAYDDAPVICALSWHELESKPLYTAISYVWGSDEQNSTIILSGKEVKTTASALTALRGLRSRWQKKNFWIDAICIDQTSDVDKAEQLCIMADIYRNAKQVTVWLGPGEEGALALSLARRLLVRFSLVDAMGSSRFSLDTPEPAWKALQKLLTNPWFERSWVVQEVMSGNIIVRYGDSQLDWTVLSQFAMAVERDIHSMVKLHLPLESNDRSSLKGGTLKISYIRIMEEFRSMHSGNDRHLSLLFYLVRMFRSTSRFKATNTQDRIYALLNLSGLARNADFNTLLSKSDLLGNKCPKNTPNYHARLSEFFTTTAKHFLCSGPENRRLDFLTHAGTCYTYGKTRLPNIPSWVPDWSLEDPPFIPFIGHDGTLELLQHPRLNGILEDVANLQSYDEISFSGRPKQEAARKKLNSMASEMLEKTMYRAAKETLPSYNIIDGPSLGRDILELKGVLIDGIHNISSIDFLNSRLGPTLFNDPAAISHLRDLNSTLTSWLELAYSTFHLSHEIDNPTTRLALHEAFERTLLGDLSHSTFDLTLPKAPIRPAPREDLGYAARLISYFRGLTTLDDFFGGKENSGKLFAEWIVHVETTCGGRVFGITEKGRMGLFPVGCAVGNEVCVFEGIGVPFVLRRIGEVEGKVKEERESSGAETFREGSSVENEARKSFYELVGAAYVHGIMDGEAMEGAGELTSFLLK